jgi:single-strand DNA-binding protein
MHDTNHVVLIGNLGQEPELRQTPSGKSVCNLRVATSKREGEREFTAWHAVVAWGHLAETAAALRRGDRVCVIGELRTRKYQTRAGDDRWAVEVVASFVAGEERPGQHAQAVEAPAAAGGFGDDDPDSIPF